MNAKAQTRRFGISVVDAKKLEANRRELVELAQKPEGTEARKALKKLMTHSYKPEAIPSNDWSDKASQRSAKSAEYKERGERTCRPSSKTDIKVNSYFKSKHSTPKGVK